MSDNPAKEKFFNIISHDLKSPFNSILGITSLLVTDFNKYDDTRKREMLNSLNKSSKLAYELVESSIAPYKHNASEKNIEITTNVPSDTKFSIDRNTSMTVIGNLVNNAIKFTPEGGAITINYHENGNNTELHIIDTGVGMTSEVIGKLFRVDENISTKGTNDEIGSGLGLILCKEFINKNGGNISVISEVGKGSEFIITLPK